MSGSTPGSFKSRADREKKLKGYQDTLDLQIELSKAQELKTKQAQRDMDLGVQPDLPPIRSVEEELEDLTTQRTEALKNLQEIMPRNALVGLNVLGNDLSELVLFNSNWVGFREKTRGKGKLTAAVFKTLWERYKELLDKTGDTGIEIGMTAEDFRVDEILEKIDASQRLSSRERREVAEFLAREGVRGNAGVVNEIRRAVNRGDANFDRLRAIMDSVKDEVQMTRQELADAKDEILDMIGRASRTSSTERAQIARSLQSFIESGDDQVVSSIREALQISESRQSEEMKQLTQELKTAILRSRVETIAEIVDEIHKLRDQVRQTRDISNLTQTELQQIALDMSGASDLAELREILGVPRGQYISKPRLIEFIVNLKGGAEASTPRGDDDDWLGAFEALTPEKRGTGFRTPKKPILIRGRGLPRPPNQGRYAEFGKYVIHLPSLQKGVFNVKYRSMASIEGLPSITMSQGFRDLVMSILQTGKMNIKAYRDLPKTEREAFNAAARRAGLEEVLGIDDDAYEMEDARKRLLERFEVLRGELLAGNDASQLKKELKAVVVRMVDHGLMRRNQALSLLVELL